MITECPRCGELMRNGICQNEECGFQPRQRKAENENKPRVPLQQPGFTPADLFEYTNMLAKSRAEFHVKLLHPRRRRHIQKYPMHRRWAIRVVWRAKLGDWRIPGIALDMAHAALRASGGEGGREHDWSKLKSILRKRELEIREKQRAENERIEQERANRA